MLVKITGGSVQGINATLVTVEVNVGNGNRYYIVGLPDTAIRESFQRIEAALKNNGLKMPRQKIVVNLSPADLKKEGSAYDLPIAAGILAASGQLDAGNLAGYMIMGELSLDGCLQPIKGILPLAIKAREEGLRGLIIPAANLREASVISDLELIGLHNLAGLLQFFNEGVMPHLPELPACSAVSPAISSTDFADVRGQHHVKRAMEIAAAGGHNILLIGSPGAGKTMLANRLPGILPELTLDEALETTRIHSVAGYLKNQGLIALRPFRAPHHTVSDIALTGGGRDLRPGEISLAHNGILFLDELPEFSRSALEVLRQPLEDRMITISRVKYTLTYPAGFMLVAAMNPCACGYLGHPDRECTCTASARIKYRSRVSGPLLDRIDLHIEVSPVTFHDLNSDSPEENSKDIRTRVSSAREIQGARFASRAGYRVNAAMNSADVRRFCQCDQESLMLLEGAMKRLYFSARAYNRILKVARTIADLQQSIPVTAAHISEAIQYRTFDRHDR